MPRVRKGKEVEKNGKWYARIRWTEINGKRRDAWFPAKNKTHASEIIEQKIGELKSVGTRAIDGDRVKFSKLAEVYRERKLIPAKFVGSTKVAGLKSYKTPRRILKTLTEHFGKRPIKSITHSDVEQYKLMRLDTPTTRGQRQIAGVNRELEVLRACFRFAIREGWLMRSPFELGDPLISQAAEVKRERILTHEEEMRLLAACGERVVTYKRKGRFKGKETKMIDKGEKREHLRPLIIAALDTACRRGELFKMRWADVDLVGRTLTIRAENSKTARPRIIGMTPRLYEELTKLWVRSSRDENALVFGLSYTIKTAWGSLCKDAGIEGLRFHDLRHTAITRMVQTRQPSALIMKVSGHTQHSTFARYVNPSAEMVVGVAQALADFNEQANGSVQQSDAVN